MPKWSKRKTPASPVRRSVASLEAEAAKETAVAAGLAQQTEQRSAEFIRTELEMGLTFAQCARLYKDPHRSRQAADRAAKAYRTVLEKLSEAHPGQQDREWIEEQMKKLQLTLQQLTNPPG